MKEDGRSSTTTRPNCIATRPCRRDFAAAVRPRREGPDRSGAPWATRHGRDDADHRKAVALGRGRARAGGAVERMRRVRHLLVAVASKAPAPLFNNGQHGVRPPAAMICIDVDGGHGARGLCNLLRSAPCAFATLRLSAVLPSLQPSISAMAAAGAHLGADHVDESSRLPLPRGAAASTARSAGVAPLAKVSAHLAQSSSAAGA